MTFIGSYILSQKIIERCFIIIFSSRFIREIIPAPRFKSLRETKLHFRNIPYKRINRYICTNMR